LGRKRGGWMVRYQSSLGSRGWVCLAGEEGSIGGVCCSRWGRRSTVSDTLGNVLDTYPNTHEPGGPRVKRLLVLKNGRGWGWVAGEEGGIDVCCRARALLGHRPSPPLRHVGPQPLLASHQPSNCLPQVLDLIWNSPKSSVLWDNSG